MLKQPKLSIREIDASKPDSGKAILELALQRASQMANLLADLRHAGYTVTSGSQVFKYQTDTAKVELCAKSVVGVRNGERVEFQTLDSIISPFALKKRKLKEDKVDDSESDSSS